MDAPILLNVLSLAVAASALITAVWAARLQVGAMHRTNQIPIIADIFSRPVSDDWVDSERYVMNCLANEYDSSAGIYPLPAEARHHIRRVCYHYDNIGKLVAHGVVEPRLAIGSWGGGASSAWQKLAPYIYQERRLRENNTMAYFEDFAARAGKLPPKQVHESLRLRKLPPV